MATERTTCNLRFFTSLENERIIRVPEPRTGLTAQNVLDAAAAFISANPFDATIGNLVSFMNAETVQTVTIHLV